LSKAIARTENGFIIKRYEDGGKQYKVLISSQTDDSFTSIVTIGESVKTTIIEGKAVTEIKTKQVNGPRNAASFADTFIRTCAGRFLPVDHLAFKVKSIRI
jgi:hypothetical protein